MKYKVTYLNQWGFKRTKTISADDKEQANAKATDYVKSTDYAYMPTAGIVVSVEAKEEQP